jgi:hypothetical protein
MALLSGPLVFERRRKTEREAIAPQRLWFFSVESAYDPKRTLRCESYGMSGAIQAWAAGRA